MSNPSLRWNALKLGFSLLWLAANPYSGLTRQASHKGSWQPEHPFGLPRWYPWAPTSGRLVGLTQLELLRLARRSADLYPGMRAPNQRPALPTTVVDHQLSREARLIRAKAGIEKHIAANPRDVEAQSRLANLNRQLGA